MMQTLARGPGAGWHWLLGGFRVFRHNTGAVLGGAAWLCVFALVLVAIEMVLPAHGPMLVGKLAITTVLSSILMPLLTGGYLRLIDASRNGRPASALLVLQPFRPGQGGARLVGFGLCMLIVYVAFFAIVVATVGRGMAAWYLQFLAHQPTLGTAPSPLPPLPTGFAPTLALVTVFFLFYGAAMAIGVGEASLRAQAPLAALRSGVAGAFKNVLPILVLCICGLILLVLLSLTLGLVVVIVSGVAMLLSKVLGLVLLAIFYIVFILLLYAFSMGVNYSIWHDVTAVDAAPPPLPAP